MLHPGPKSPPNRIGYFSTLTISHILRSWCVHHRPTWILSGCFFSGFFIRQDIKDLHSEGLSVCVFPWISEGESGASARIAVLIQASWTELESRKLARDFGCLIVTAAAAVDSFDQLRFIHRKKQNLWFCTKDELRRRSGGLQPEAVRVEIHPFNP